MANALDILSSLLQKTPDANSAQDSLGPATLQQLNKVGATGSDAVGPYQQGVAKALKALGEKHATEAVQAGVSPTDIQNHDIMNPQSDTLKVLSSLVALATPQAQSNDSSSINQQSGIKEQQPTQNDNSSQLTPLQQQAMDIIQPQGVHPLGLLLNLIGNVTGMSAANQAINSIKLDNIGKAQKVIAGQPAEIAVPEAQAKQLLQKISGQEPIQPYEAAQLRAGQNTAQITALNDSIDTLQKRRDSLNQEFLNEQKTISAGAKMGNLLSFKGQNMTPRMVAIKKEQFGIDKQLANAQSKLINFLPINPMAVQGTHTPQQISLYNKLRASGVSQEEARQKAGF